MNKSLYEDKHPTTSLKGTGYANKEKAIHTLKIIQKFDLTYQKQVILTMYNRAKFHRFQTQGMLDAMKVYKKWLKSYNIKI
jgi:hypothetical protein|uniref:Uncharacterized protein n=1 Tax=viral metagenome TaxID=1070528 RepID=A0A6C0EEH9_9ZZZZ